ncbi:MAG: hypothetical protein ABI343_09510 [Burkholderiaceae bacterium]
MAQNFGIKSSADHPAHHAHRPPVRFLLLIQSADAMVARMFLETREPAGEVDAGSEEVGTMTRGLTPAVGAAGPEWDKALSGHGAQERATAQVYTLDV